MIQNDKIETLTFFLVFRPQCPGILWRTDYYQFLIALSEIRKKKKVINNILRIERFISHFFATTINQTLKNDLSQCGYAHSNLIARTFSAECNNLKKKK